MAKTVDGYNLEKDSQGARKGDYVMVYFWRQTGLKPTKYAYTLMKGIERQTNLDPEGLCTA